MPKLLRYMTYGLMHDWSVLLYEIGGLQVYVLIQKTAFHFVFNLLSTSNLWKLHFRGFHEDFLGKTVLNKD